MAVTVKDIPTPTTRDQAYGDGAIYRFLAAPVVLTADLPAASDTMNGRIIIEDGGDGDINLIVYAQNKVFRINGGTAL